MSRTIEFEGGFYLVTERADTRTAYVEKFDDSNGQIVNDRIGVVEGRRVLQTCRGNSKQYQPILGECWAECAAFAV